MSMAGLFDDEATKTKGGGEREVNKLTNKQFVVLLDTIRSNLTKFEVRRVTYAEAAVMLSDELGFTITDHNVAGICRDFELSWIRSRGPGSSKKKAATNDRLRVLARELKSQHADIRYLANVCHGIFVTRGEKSPDQLVDIAYGPCPKAIDEIARGQKLSSVNGQQLEGNGEHQG